MRVSNWLKDQGLEVGVVVVRDLTLAPLSPELKEQIEQLITERQQQEFPPASLKDAVRNLLKTGGFKPSGRSKPASEYLAQAAREGRFPFINNLVDVNNFVSLQSGLPISLLDLDAVGLKLSMRFGKQGERYVFNSAGHEIDLQGLICACNGENDTPLGNPVKDSLDGKIKDSTKSVVGIIYSPLQNGHSEKLQGYLATFAHWLSKEANTSKVETFVA